MRKNIHENYFSLLIIMNVLWKVEKEFRSQIAV